MFVRWIAPWIFAASAASAFAQSPNVLSGRPEADAQFARKLFDRQQTELAEAICGLLEKSGKLSGKAAVEVRSLYIDLRLEIAKKTADLPKRKDLLKQALADKEDFIKQNQGTPEAETASITLPDAYALLGDTLKKMVETETQPSVIADYQSEGQKVYAEAEDRLKTRIEELTKLKDEKDERGEEDEDLVNQLMTARFNLPRTYYGHAQLYGKDEFRRKELLGIAITLLQEFGLDFSGVAFTYYAQILEGQCEKELGNTENALQIWAGVANELKEGWETDKNGIFQINSDVCDIVAQALFQRALYLTELGRAQEGIAEVRDFFAKYAGAYETDKGLPLLAQLGEMQLAANDTEGASKTAQKLIDLDGNGPWGRNGQVLQDKLLGKGGGVGVGVAKLLQLAGTQYQRRNENRALELCRQAIAEAKGDPKESANGLAAFLLLGDIFRGREWYHEATLAYDAGAESYPNEPDAAEAVYRSLQCFTEIKKTEKRPAIERRISERMKTLTTRYPTHPRASFALIVEGQGYEGDDEFLKAAQTYEKVQPDAKSYIVAQFSAGNAYFLHARTLARDAAKKAEAKPFYDQSMSILRKVITDVDKKLPDA
jgi:tetratricopeptide (TPR) repeat protein